MGGSTADTPTTPEYLRASDAERDNAVSELRNEFAEGRLSHETFMYRMQSALDARHRGQLAGLFTDLPPRRPGLMARIRAMLRGEDAEAGEGRPDGNGGIPRTQQVAGHSFGQPDHEARSLTQSALDQQLGIHKPAIPVCERQPESGIIAIIARRLLLGAAEGFE